MLNAFVKTILFFQSVLSSLSLEMNRAIQVIILSSLSLLTCQILKSVIFSVKEKQFRWKSLFTTGGLPSSHSSTVTTLVASIGLFQVHDTGTVDYIFAVSFIVALVIIHDSVGVRLEASKHAIILNNMVENEPIEEKKKLGFGKRGYLKELLGHEKIEAFAGVLYGLVIAVIGYFICI